MSYPQNPLDKYRSHSVHYILLVSSNTENLREVVDPANNNNFLANISGKKLGDVIGNKDVRLLVDSRRISEFGIEKIDFITFIADMSGTTSQSSVLGSEINMRVLDPSGIGFINYFMYLQSVYQVSVINMSFLLCISFIGHTDKGTSEHIDHIMIPMISTGKMSLSEFSHKGSYIDFSTVATSMSLGSSIPHLSELPTSIQYKAVDGILGTGIQALQNAINLQALEWYKKANITTLSNTNPTQEGQIKPTEQKVKINGKLFEVMITIPQEWFKYKIEGIKDNSSEINFSEIKQQIQSNQKTSANETNAEFQENITISTAVNTAIAREINKLLMSCKDVLKNADAEKVKKGEISLFKIASSMTSDDQRTTLHFDVIPFTSANVNGKKPTIQENTSAQQNVPNRNDNTIPDNGIVFDYVFSGKNVDIEHLDIKIDNVLAWLSSKHHYGKSTAQFITGRSQKKSDLIKQPIDEKDNISIKQPKDTLYLPVANNFLQNNSVDLGNVKPEDAQEILKARSEYHKTLSNMHAAQVNNLVTIRGNPDLLKAFTVQNIMKHIPVSNTPIIDYVSTMNEQKMQEQSSWEYGDSAKPPSAKGGATIVNAQLEHRKNLEAQLKDSKGISNTSNVSTMTQAAYVKINIFGPSDTPFSLDDKSKFATQLFYDGWYQITSIEHHFEGHRFTQTINMTSLEFYGY